MKFSRAPFPLCPGPRAALHLRLRVATSGDDVGLHRRRRVFRSLV